MNREGHLGVALVAYSPIGFVALRAGFEELAVLGAGFAAVLATLPDIDTRIPLVAHRGYTHTVWFALLVGGAGFTLAAWAPLPSALPPTNEAAAFSFAVGATTICSHVAADWLTPMGVRPFAPFGDRHSFGVVRASNWIANKLLFTVGVGAIAFVFWLSGQTG